MEFCVDAVAERGSEAVELHGDGGGFSAKAECEIFEGGLIGVAGLQKASGGVLDLAEAFVEGFESGDFAIAFAIFLDAVIEGGEHFIGEAGGDGAEFPAVVGEEIRGDALEPWLESALGAALADFPEGGDEDFLGEVLDIVVMAEPDREIAADAALVAEDKRGECGGVTILRLADESRFVVGVWGGIHDESARWNVLTGTTQHADGKIS